MVLGAGFGVQIDPDSKVMAAHEEIVGAISLHHTEGAVAKDDKDRLLGALELKSRAVEEIMLHRSEIETDRRQTARQTRSSPKRSNRPTPAFRSSPENPENIVGVLHAKDLLRDLLNRMTIEGRAALNSFRLEDVMMKPYFVPETTSLDIQMRQFLRRHAHFALIVDEYGALQGLITLEDILEEIVGDISDEHDIEAEGIERQETGAYLVDGSTTIRDLNRACDWTLPDDEANTLAGLVIHEAQTIPTEGQVFVYHGFRFEVIGRERNRLTKIRVTPLPKTRHQS